MTSSRSQAGAMALGGGAQVICSFPSFLAGAMAVQLSADLGFGATGLGIAIGLYHASAAASAIPLGRLVDRIGARRAIRAAATGAIVSTLGIAALANNVYVLTVFLMVAGLSRAIAQPGANRLLMVRIRPGMLATAFGIKQSAAPTASMLAGLAVPAFALTVGWRWAYVLGALFGLTVLVSTRTRGNAPTPARKAVSKTDIRDRPTIVLLGAAFGLSLGVAAIVTSFYVTSAVEVGTAQGTAGWLLATASLTSISVRLIAGVICDRIPIDPLKLSARLMGIGVVGLAMLSTGRPALMTTGVILAMGGTWGFAGVFWFALIRAYADMPGRITGALAPAAMGGVLGPAIFGALAERWSFAAGWSFAAFLALAGTGMLYVGARRVAAATG